MAVMPVVDRAPSIHAVRAAADVVFTDERNGFCASVYYQTGEMAAARLDRSIRGTPHWGEVLEQVMLATTGLHGEGLHVWWLSPSGSVIR